jgi:sirohydrochlorin cobaltochelatase
MAEVATGTLLALRDIALQWNPAEAEELAGVLSARLQQPVIFCMDGDPARSLQAGGLALAAMAIERVVVLPVGLLPDGRAESAAVVAERMQRQHPQVQFHLATPLTWLECAQWLRATVHDVLAANRVQSCDAALLLISSGSSDPLANADVARLAQLLREALPWRCVEHALLDGLPSLAQAAIALASCHPKHLVRVPWRIGQFSDWQHDEAWRDWDESTSGAQLLTATPRLAHSGLANLLVANYYTALDDQPVTSRLVKTGRAELASQSALSLEEAYELEQLEKRLNALLPPEYQEGKYEEVRPQSMGTAQLKLDDEGKVAWDQIWTSFCDLALAGGPPHRGTLLEAVTGEEAASDIQRYREVVAEIERGIRMVTGLEVVPSPVLGWVGIRCHSEEMAVWLMRAIIVENVMVRREGNTIYLPAGPKFTLKREIKNVITTVAKTVHYWSAHLKMRQPH